jgi:hypothetical protein
MVEHMENNNLIEDSQHGFVRGRSCATNLIEFFDYVTSIVDGGGAADAVFLDFAKAFDKVPKKRLLEKIRSIGIGGKVYTWIENWLSGRKQRVVLEGEGSDWDDVTSGVPQGSVLGPVLFLIFIRDLDRATVGGTRVKKFADNTKAANQLRNEADRADLQQTLDNMMDWASKWGMEFNRKKCKVMHFGAANPKHQYSMGGHILDEITEEKDVGVTVSNNLKPGAHCSRAAKTATVVLGQIGRSFKYRDKKIFPRLYTRYVRPHLEFSSTAWSPWLQKDIDTLEKVQKRAVSMVNGLTGATYAEKLAEIGLDSLSDRRAEADLVQMYKIIHGFSTVNKRYWFDMATRTVNITRMAANELCVKIPFARTDKRKNFYTVRIGEMWNGLPKNIRAAKSVAHFKRIYRTYAQSNHRGPGET